LDRGKKITISDKYQLKEWIRNTELRYLTPMKCTVLSPGIIEMKGDDFVLHLKYNPKTLSARIEKKEMDDPRLQSVWENNLNVLILDITGQNKANQVAIEIIKVR